jgi:histidinol-phosphatase (PHP family)
MGLDELGVSDHLVLEPHDEPPHWSMRASALSGYLAALEQAAQIYEPTLRTGIEVDWLPGQQQAIASALADPRFDYVIGSVHQVSGIHVDSAADRLGRMGPGALETMYRRYWDLIRDMAMSGLFDIAAHLDLPKKLLGRPQAARERGVLPDVGDAPNVEAALDAIARAGMTVELNTAGWDMPCRECYPSPRILAACHARGIPVTIGADAHSTQHLLRHFGRAVTLLQDIGYREIMRFEGRQALPQPLSEFAAALARP